MLYAFIRVNKEGITMLALKKGIIAEEDNQKEKTKQNNGKLIKINIVQKLIKAKQRQMNWITGQSLLKHPYFNF